MIAFLLPLQLLLLYLTRKRICFFIYFAINSFLVLAQYIYLDNVVEARGCLPLLKSIVCRSELITVFWLILCVQLASVLVILIVLSAPKKSITELPNLTKGGSFSRIYTRNTILAWSLIPPLTGILVLTNLNPSISLIMSINSSSEARNVATIVVLCLTPRALCYANVLAKKRYEQHETLGIIGFILFALLFSRSTALCILIEVLIVNSYIQRYPPREELIATNHMSQSRMERCGNRRDKKMTRLIHKYLLFIMAGAILLLYGNIRDIYANSRAINADEDYIVKSVLDVDTLFGFIDKTFLVSSETISGLTGTIKYTHHSISLALQIFNNLVLSIFRNFIPLPGIKDYFSARMLDSNIIYYSVNPSPFELGYTAFAESGVVLINIIYLIAIFLLEQSTSRNLKRCNYCLGVLQILLTSSLLISLRGAPWASISTGLATSLCAALVFRFQRFFS